MSGGAGYVLSKEAVIRFVEKGLPYPEKCRSDNAGDEDVEIGICLDNVNVTAGDSRDNYNRGRFFPFTPEGHLFPGKFDPNFWYWKFLFYPTNDVRFL